MPLPLPNLDTRRWLDLVEEGRSLIPRYAPNWTDHNVHDPGITLMELFAWVTDLALYRTNAIPDRHRRKFLALIGFPPQPPQPTQTAFAFTPTGLAAATVLPAGTTVATTLPATHLNGLRFQTQRPLKVLLCKIKSIQSFNGTQLIDNTQANNDSTPYYPWGSDPPPPEPLTSEQHPAVYLGFEAALPTNEPLSLWLQFIGRGTDWQERDRILTEDQQMRAACQSLRRSNPCPPALPSLDPWCPTNSPSSEPTAAVMQPLQHHTLQSIWEYYDGSQWQILDPERDEIVDETRGFSLSGAVLVKVPGSMGESTVGLTTAFYLRCRLVKGLPDAAPRLATVRVNAVAATQISPVRSTFPIAANVTPSSPPVIGAVNKLSFALNHDGEITSLTLNPGEDALEAWVLDYQAATAAPGRLTLTLQVLGRGSGFPEQMIQLEREIAIAHNQIQLWILRKGKLQRWLQQPDLDASQRTDAHFQWEPTTQTIHFGDGEQGRVVPEEAWILAAYDRTAGAGGNVLKSLPWQLLGADDQLNQAILGKSQSELKDLAQTLAIAPCAPFTGGTNPEELDHAAGRAVETLWAHERLIDLCPPTHSPTLDQLEQTQVLHSQAPERAVTLLDFERLALEVPGTRVARARAWAGLDPAYPCVKAPGTVTVVIVPELPQHLPHPSPGLLATVQRYLDRRRSIGTRLVVVAPDYLEVRVQATVRTQRNVNVDRVAADILTALNQFLDPLKGGVKGLGYPFGRDVYRTEILQVIDEVTGVDHVVELRLTGQPPGENPPSTQRDRDEAVAAECDCSGNRQSTHDSGSSNAAQCGNLCVAPTQLVASGPHTIQVLRGGTP